MFILDLLVHPLPLGRFQQDAHAAGVTPVFWMHLPGLEDGLQAQGGDGVDDGAGEGVGDGAGGGDAPALGVGAGGIEVEGVDAGVVFVG